MPQRGICHSRHGIGQVNSSGSNNLWFNRDFRIGAELGPPLALA
jgi:hypothetical protein